MVCGACCEGMDKQLERLLEKGADPNSREPVRHLTVVLLIRNTSITNNIMHSSQTACANSILDLN